MFNSYKCLIKFFETILSTQHDALVGGMIQMMKGDNTVGIECNMLM